MKVDELNDLDIKRRAHTLDKITGKLREKKAGVKKLSSLNVGVTQCLSLDLYIQI